jgi:ADP-ribose pyrophosphatase YjhB (NUDIX family)
VAQRDTVVILLPDEQGRLLFVREAGYTYHNMLFFPSGKINPVNADGEEPRFADELNRELKEETGWAVRSVTGLYWFTGKNLSTGDTIFFSAARVTGRFDCTVRPDSLETLWLTHAEISARLENGEFRDPDVVIELLRALYCGEFEPGIPNPPKTISYQGNGRYQKPPGHKSHEDTHDYMRFHYQPSLEQRALAAIGRVARTGYEKVRTRLFA